MENRGNTEERMEKYRRREMDDRKRRKRIREKKHRGRERKHKRSVGIFPPGN